MHRHLLRAGTVAALTLGLLGPGGTGAAAEPTWAPADQATIHPGVQMYTDGAQCTANFVFTDRTDVYIGYAAHCAATGAATDTDGCLAESLPIGTSVEIDGADRPGTLAYSSWERMQAVGETDGDACTGNDFALVLVDPADHGHVNPTIPHWGGPTGLNTSGNPLGSTVYSYGSSSLRLGLTVLSPKRGISLGTTGNGWSHPTYTVTPGIPGDSGSAMLDSDGRASGVLSTLTLAPTAGSNDHGDLALALDYLRTNAPDLAGIELSLGTEPFTPNRLPLGGLTGLTG